MTRVVALMGLSLAVALAPSDQCARNRAHGNAGVPERQQSAAPRGLEARSAPLGVPALAMLPIVLWDEGIRPVIGTTMTVAKDVWKRLRRGDERTKNLGEAADQRIPRQPATRDPRVALALPFPPRGLSRARVGEPERHFGSLYTIPVGFRCVD
jgi:hypothetical protein